MKPKKSAKSAMSGRPGKGGKKLPKASGTKKAARTTKAAKPAVAKAKPLKTKPLKTKPLKTKPAKAKTPARPAASQESWNLRLYVAGQTPRSITAFSNLKQICEERLAGRYKIEVIDLVKQPQLAQGDQIVAIPTLVRKLPEPIKRVVGDLSNLERVLVGMDLQATPTV